MIVRKLLRLITPRLAEKIYYGCICGRTERPHERDLRKVSIRGDNTSMFVVAGDVISDSIYWTGLYEASASKAMRRIASDEGGLMVDVGANIGYFTLLWLSSHPENQVVAVEASAENAKILRSNLRENGFENRCRVLEIAASTNASEVNFDLGPREQTGWGGISKTDVGADPRVIRVQTDSLDRILDQHTPVRLLKVDVEGAETLVFEGAADMLSRRQAQEIWSEDNEPRRLALEIETERLTRELLRHDYSISCRVDDPSLPMDFVATAPTGK